MAAKVADKDKTIVVMVCNFGQSELLFNFVCSAKSRGMDLSRILLFATDKDIIDLAESLGLAFFDVQDAFGEMPTAAARKYGDKRFAGKFILCLLLSLLLFLKFGIISSLAVSHLRKA